MNFNVNHPLLFVIVGAIIAIVLAQSAFFLSRAIKRAKELGLGEHIKKTIISAAIFTVAPAVAVLIGVVALSKSLGIPLPWLRLSVIGSITYETVAAGNALEAANMSAGTTVTDPSIYITIAWVMTVGIAAGLILVPFAAVAPACDLLAYSHPPIPVAFHSQVSVVTCHIYLAPVPCPT